MHQTGIGNFRVFNYTTNKIFAPLAQLAEQVTLNCDRSEVIGPSLPNKLRKFDAGKTAAFYEAQFAAVTAGKSSLPDVARPK